MKRQNKTMKGQNRMKKTIFCVAMLMMMTCTSCSNLGSVFNFSGMMPSSPLSPYTPLSSEAKSQLQGAVVSKIEHAPSELGLKVNRIQEKIDAESARPRGDYEDEQIQENIAYWTKEKERYTRRLEATGKFIARLKEPSEITKYRCKILEFDTAPHVVLYIQDGKRFRNEESMHDVYEDIDKKKTRAFEIVRAMAPIIYENQDLKIDDIAFTGMATYVNPYGKETKPSKVFEFHFAVDRANRVDKWEDAALSYLVQEKYDIMLSQN
jgi:hypothetical protein